MRDKSLEMLHERQQHLKKKRNEEAKKKELDAKRGNRKKKELNGTGLVLATLLISIIVLFFDVGNTSNYMKRITLVLGLLDSFVILICYLGFKKGEKSFATLAVIYGIIGILTVMIIPGIPISGILLLVAGVMAKQEN